MAGGGRGPCGGCRECLDSPNCGAMFLDLPSCFELVIPAVDTEIDCVDTVYPGVYTLMNNSAFDGPSRCDSWTARENDGTIVPGGFNFEGECFLSATAHRITLTIRDGMSDWRMLIRAEHLSEIVAYTAPLVVSGGKYQAPGTLNKVSGTPKIGPYFPASLTVEPVACP